MEKITRPPLYISIFSNRVNLAIFKIQLLYTFINFLIIIITYVNKRQRNQ